MPKKHGVKLDIARDTDYDTNMILAVIGTNVLIAALRSSSGASYQIILAADRGDFEVALSIPLLAEYDDVTSRPNRGIKIPMSAVSDIIDRIAQISRKQAIFYLWRNILPDPKDDMVLEVAVASGATHIITFNKKDFKPASEFGISVVQPSEFLRLIR